ncbi:hypothetical protein CMI41_03880 [Candidatus Pacearchaeota archaeon]|nr:hypothetical protein [Candidatus Pacearchaeota archaeon]|tara:strand:+ start:3180 stop:3383 length:204 start_codon:yes stop_codon:yes gene_type:complete
MSIVIGLARVSGYCRVRDYDGCATQEEVDTGRALGLNRPATRDECFSHMIQQMKIYRESQRPREGKS